MKPNAIPSLVCLLLVGHTAHYGTYEGLPELTDGATQVTSVVGPTWQTPDVVGRFDSEDPRLGVAEPLPTASIVVTGSGGQVIAPKGVASGVGVGTPSVTLSEPEGRFGSEQPTEPVASPATKLGTSGRLTVTKAVGVSWAVEGASPKTLT